MPLVPRVARPAAEAGRLGAGGCKQRGQSVGVIAVRVGDEHVAEPALADGFEDGFQVRGILGAGIDQREIVAADDVGVGALEGERAGIVGNDADHAGRQLARHSVGEVHGRSEFRSFGHAGSWLVCSGNGRWVGGAKLDRAAWKVMQQEHIAAVQHMRLIAADRNPGQI